VDLSRLMRLTVVGSAPAYSLEPCRASSCYLVEHGDTAIVLDFGQGAFGALAAYRSPDSVDAIVISHLHADHCVDLVPLRHFVKFERGGRGPALYGPAELRPRFNAFQVHDDFFDDLPGGALDEASFSVGSVNIETRRITHIPDSFAFRVSVADGESEAPGLVYSGDCGEWPDLLPLIRPGDTLLCEAALGAGGTEGGPHLTAAEAASAARDGAAARLILTHILERNDMAATLGAAREVLGWDAEIAGAGLSIDIG
jgi:ribonuclease BN (tRNA processing enzyme)